MSDSDTELTELQFLILDGMADDYENIEQLYLFVNRDLVEERRLTLEFPRQIIRVRYALHTVIDVIAEMLREGYIEAKYSNDKDLAPLRSLDFAGLHHYWFGPTEKGTKLWEAHPHPTSDT